SINVLGDPLLAAVLVGMVPFGLLMVGSASFVDAITTHGGQAWYYAQRQLVGCVFGAGIFAFGLRTPYRIWHRSALGLMLVVLGLLALVLVLPITITQVNGARSWFRFGTFSFQPAELAKFAIIVYFARWLSRRAGQVADAGAGLVPYALMMGIMCGLVMLQPDLGTTTVLVLIGGIMYIAAGARLLHIALALVISSTAFWAMVRLAPYRADRIAAWLDPFSHYDGAGYQPVHALSALARGGIFGVGLGQSREKFLWLPQAHTDTILAIIGEEFGFLGTLAVILCFAIIAWRGIRIALRAPDSFGRLLAVGITAWLVGQAIINMSVVVGLIPFTGLTLPFISYGSSSIMTCLLAGGVLLNIARASDSPHASADARSE
ncbi:MAG: putative lipid II flippase FtsW, partial [Kouleothrix sp.]